MGANIDDAKSAIANPDAIDRCCRRISRLENSAISYGEDAFGSVIHSYIEGFCRPNRTLTGNQDLAIRRIERLSTA